MLQDPSIPLISKKFAQRKMARLNGSDIEEARAMFPADIHELIAMENLELLNMNKMPNIREAALDPLTHRMVSFRAIETKAKFAYIE